MKRMSGVLPIPSQTSFAFIKAATEVPIHIESSQIHDAVCQRYDQEFMVHSINGLTGAHPSGHRRLARR